MLKNNTKNEKNNLNNARKGTLFLYELLMPHYQWVMNLVCEAAFIKKGWLFSKPASTVL